MKGVPEGTPFSMRYRPRTCYKDFLGSLFFRGSSGRSKRSWPAWLLDGCVSSRSSASAWSTQHSPRRREFAREKGLESEAGGRGEPLTATTSDRNAQ